MNVGGVTAANFPGKTDHHHAIYSFELNFHIYLPILKDCQFQKIVRKILQQNEPVTNYDIILLSRKLVRESISTMEKR